MSTSQSMNRWRGQYDYQAACLVVGLSKSCATLWLTFRGLRTGAIGNGDAAGGPGRADCALLPWSRRWRSGGSRLARTQAAPGVPGFTAPVDLLSVRWRIQLAAAHSVFLDPALCYRTNRPPFIAELRF